MMLVAALVTTIVLLAIVPSFILWALWRKSEAARVSLENLLHLEHEAAAAAARIATDRAIEAARAEGRLELGGQVMERLAFITTSLASIDAQIGTLPSEVVQAANQSVATAEAVPWQTQS